MGTTSVLRKRQCVVLVLATVLALCAQTTEGALTFINTFSHDLFLYHPPGCCSVISGFHPPPPGYGCARCPIVYLAPNGVRTTLDPIVGPYPLQFLQIIGHGGTYCMIGRNLKATNIVTIGPKGCGEDGLGIETKIEATEDPIDAPVTFCMTKCLA